MVSDSKNEFGNTPCSLKETQEIKEDLGNSKLGGIPFPPKKINLDISNQANLSNCTSAMVNATGNKLIEDVELGDKFSYGIGEIQAAIEVKERYEELKEALEDVKLAKAAFKEKGYERLSTTDSIFNIEFPDDFTHEKKCAVMLFMMQYYVNGKSAFVLCER